MVIAILVLAVTGAASAADMTLEGFLETPKQDAPTSLMREMMEGLPLPEAHEAMLEKSAGPRRLETSGSVIELVEYSGEGDEAGLRQMRRVSDDVAEVHFKGRSTVHFGAAPTASITEAELAAYRAAQSAQAEAARPARGARRAQLVRAPARSRTGLQGRGFGANRAGVAVGYAQTRTAQAPIYGPALIQGAGLALGGQGSAVGQVNTAPTATPAPGAARSERVDMTNVNTNTIDYLCTMRGAHCRPGGHDGETVVTSENSFETISHFYDQKQPYGSRNTYVVRQGDGHTFSWKGSPLILDLKGKGVRVSDRKVRYDIDGDGVAETIRDISSGGGLLVFDADKDGVSGSRGRELFGDNTDLNGDGRKDGYADGFEALWGMVRRAVRAGVIPSRVFNCKVLESRDLAALEKAYGLKIRVGGLGKKAISLKAAGVATISLSEDVSRMTRDFDGQGNDVARREGASFTRTDGSVGSYEDVWFAFERGPVLARRSAPAPAPSSSSGR